MSQSICRRIRDQINLLRDQPHLPFSDLLDADLVGEVLGEEGVHYRERIFSPLVTLWTFLTQVLSLDHCCRKAVACLIAYRTARGQDPCSADSGSYCNWRQRAAHRCHHRVGSPHGPSPRRASAGGHGCGSVGRP